MNKTTKRRTRIDIETHEITIIRTNSEHRREICVVCGQTVSLFAPEQAASMLRVPAQFLNRFLDANQIHWANNAALCGESLLDHFTQQATRVEYKGEQTNALQ